MAAGQHIFKFFDSKSEIAKKANASGSDSEAFFALEQIKQNEKAPARDVHLSGSGWSVG
jgi:hypothetical protein